MIGGKDDLVARIAELEIRNSQLEEEANGHRAFLWMLVQSIGGTVNIPRPIQESLSHRCTIRMETNAMDGSVTVTTGLEAP